MKPTSPYGQASKYLSVRTDSWGGGGGGEGGGGGRGEGEGERLWSHIGSDKVIGLNFN